MADAISIQELIDARTDAKTLEEAVNGDAVTTVLSRLGETYPTLSNALNQIDSKLDSADAQIKQGITDLFQNGGLPATPFATKALMTASALADGKYAMVTDDTINNGLYVKTAGAWVKSGYNPVAQANTYTDEKTKEIDTIVSDVELLKNGGVLVYDSSNYTPISGRTTYSETSWISSLGVTKAYASAQVKGSVIYLVGKKADGSTVNLASGVGYEKPETISVTALVSIPSDVVALKATSMNNTHEYYLEDMKPPRLILSNSEDLIYKKLRDLYSIKSYSGFPIEKHANTASMAYNSTLYILVTKGVKVDYKVNTAGIMSGVLYNSETGDSTTINTSQGVINVDADGYLRLSTYNPRHASYDENLQPYYTVHYDDSETEIQGRTGEMPSKSSYLNSFTLKTIREHLFLDGTDRLPVEYLWHDNDWNFYVSKDKYSKREFIFRFTPSEFYDREPHEFSVNYDKYGNLIFVLRTEHLTGTYDNSVRENPIVLLRDDGYKPQQIDLGDRLKPGGWFQNCGFIYTDEAIFFTEYVRAQVKTAHTWKVEYPITDPINWKTVQNFAIDAANNLEGLKVIKHMHSINRDPYTGHLYTSTGDSPSQAAIFVSTDNGDSFSVVKDESEKHCRVLGFVFTKDYIYWSTDSNGALHWVFKAPRDESGVLDANAIVEIQRFPNDSAPTYASIYFKSLDAILMLGRQDGSSPSVAVDVFDMRTEQLVRVDVLPPVDNVPSPLGFRCECFEYYPRGNVMICGFSKSLDGGGYRNYLGILGNTLNYNTMIYNVVIHLSRSDDGFNINYSTVS